MIMFMGLLAWEYHDLHMKNKKVCNKTRSPPASLLFKGQGTEHTTVKWPIKKQQQQTKTKLNQNWDRANSNNNHGYRPLWHHYFLTFNLIIAMQKPAFLNMDIFTYL